MSTYLKFSEILRNHERRGTTPSKPPRALTAVKPDVDPEPTLDDLGALGGVPRRIQNSPSASGAAKGDETGIAGREVHQDVSGDVNGGASDHLKHLNQLNLPQSQGDGEEKWAATVEYGVDTPRDWVEGFARLHPDRAPADVPPNCWQTLIHDVRRFLEGRWAEKALALGWSEYELFGADCDRPFARLDKQGLCWLIKAGRLVGLSTDAAVIETCSGARHTYRRRPTEVGRALAWDLTNTMSQLRSHCGLESQACKGVVDAEIEFPTDLPHDFGKNRGV
jgi:hypothetical protein